MQKQEQKRLLQALLSALILITFYNYVAPIQEANALSRVSVSTGFNNIQFTKFVPNNSGVTQYLAVGNFSGTDTITHGGSKINVYNANSSGLISSFDFHQVLRSGLMNGYTFDNISCDKTGNSQLCAIGLTSSTTSSMVFLVDIGKQLVMNNNTRFLMSSSLIPVVSLFNDGGLTHIYVYEDDGANTHVLTLGYNTTGSLTDTKNRLVQLADIQSAIRFSGVGNSDTAVVNNGVIAGQYIMFMNTASLQLWSIGQAKRICGLNLAGGGNAGDIDYVNDATGQYWLASDQVSTLYKVDFTCAQLTASDFTTQITAIHSISHNSGRQEVYIIGTTAKLLVVNETTLSTTVLLTFGGLIDVGVHFNNLATNDANSLYLANNPFVAVGSGGNPATLTIFYWQLAQGAGSGSGGTSNTCSSISSSPHCKGDVNCDLPANANLAMCVSTFQQNPITGNSQLISTGVNNILVSAGLINGSNTNIKTNGTGYILLIIAIIITIALMLYASKMVLPIPNFVWMFVFLMLVGLGVLLQWVDVTFFIIGVVALVALAAPKIREVIGGLTNQ